MIELEHPGPAMQAGLVEPGREVAVVECFLASEAERGFATLFHDHRNDRRIVCGSLQDVRFEPFPEVAEFANHGVILRDRGV